MSASTRLDLTLLGGFALSVSDQATRPTLARKAKALLAFGLDQARSDDCERALHAAVRLRAALAEHPGGVVSAALDCGPALRGSVETGAEATAQRNTRGIGASGPVLHRCGALLRAAADAEILLSEAVRRQVQDRVEVVAIPVEVSAASGADPVARYWRLIALSATPRSSDIGLVGRRRELALLRSGLQALLETGAGHVLLIRGEAGIGKTRLVEAACAEAAALGIGDSLVRVLDFGTGSAADPPSALMRALLGLADQAPPRIIGEALTDVLAPHGLDAAGRRALGPLIGLVSDADPAPMDGSLRARTLRDVAEALLRAATLAGPRLLLVEDIHWSAPSMLALLAALAEATAQSAAMLIMTTRFEVLRRDLLLTAAEALFRAGCTELARARFDQAVALAQAQTADTAGQASEPSRILARALLGRAVAETSLDQPHDALTSLALADSAASRADDAALGADIRFQRGNVLFYPRILYGFVSAPCSTPATSRRRCSTARGRSATARCPTPLACCFFSSPLPYAPPLQALFGTAAIDAGGWLRIVLVSASVLSIVELEKAPGRRRHRKPQPAE